MTGDENDAALADALRRLRQTGRARARTQQRDQAQLNELRVAVATAHAAGASYEDIGELLGVSRQMAQKYHRGAPPGRAGPRRLTARKQDSAA